jgi:ATP phosphoribosyltransferase
MRLAVPSPTSRLHPVAFAALEAALGDLGPPSTRGRALVQRLPSKLELLYCRGTDVPQIVARGVADAGLTGYDMAIETSLGTGVRLEMRSLAPARSSFVCYVTVSYRAPISLIYSEYPHLARSWIAATHDLNSAEIITLHGSIEGVVKVDEAAGGIVLVTSGETLQANGLGCCVPIVATDLCIVRRGSEPTAIGDLVLDTLPQLSLPQFVLDPGSL